jgi:hypothetical protein
LENRHDTAGDALLEDLHEAAECVEERCAEETCRRAEDATVPLR